MRYWWLLLAFYCIHPVALCQQSIPAIGHWREHLPYNNVIDVAAAGETVFAATPYSLFSVNTRDNAIEKWSKINGLSETGVSAICYDDINRKLVVAYSNSNIDILAENGIANIPDLKRLNISGDKSVYNIDCANQYYYLSTGLGVMVINAARLEVKDTWKIGNNGDAVKTTGFAMHNNFYYAATAEGLKKAAVNTTDPANYRNWQLASGSNGLPAGTATDVILFQQKIIALVNDTLYAEEGSQWKVFYADGWPVSNMHASAGKLILSQRKPTGESRINVLDANAAVTATLQQNGLIDQPQKAIYFNDAYWIADLTGGLSKRDNAGTFSRFIPSSPQEKASGQMVASKGVLYVAAGEVNENWNYQYNPYGIYRFADGEWTNYNRYHFPVFDSLLDFISIAVDPADESMWAGSFGSGLLHLKTGQSFELFKQNSPLKPAIGDPGSYRVAGLAFDSDHNLWIANYGAPQPLVVKKNDGSWQSFTLPFSISGNTVSEIVIDDINQKWIASPLGNGLLVFNHGKEIGSTADDQWKMYTAAAGRGNLPSNEILSIAKDKNGFIWVGTADGLAVIQCPEAAFTPNACDAYLPVIKQGNFNGYLFKSEPVRSIAVDGADRKWVATKNGVWLISAEGEKVIYNFTENNSPLLSNDVKKIAIDGSTGEVFFATAKGICSYRGTATEGQPANENVLVFPNPVPPSHNGMIAIRGVAENAIVKITELNGRLVYQARALGGQVVWDGKNYNGQRVASGVYLVLVSDDGKQEKMVTKIFFISK